MVNCEYKEKLLQVIRSLSQILSRNKNKKLIKMLVFFYIPQTVVFPIFQNWIHLDFAYQTYTNNDF